MAKNNAFQIKFKLTPKAVGYKPTFIAGIVIAKSQVRAVELATNNVKASAVSEKFEIDVKITSVVRLVSDFVFMDYKENLEA